MISPDNANYVTIDVFNSGIAELKAEIKVIDRQIEINSVKIDELHYFMYHHSYSSCFCRLRYHSSTYVQRNVLRLLNRPKLTRSEVQEMIDEALTRALSVKK